MYVKSSCILRFYNEKSVVGDLQPLKVDIPTTRYSKGVVLVWEPFEMDDPRKLLGYIVYSIEAPTQNVTLYDGRDACGGDGYVNITKIFFVSFIVSVGEWMMSPFPRMKPK